MANSSPVLRTPLYDLITEQTAKLTTFGGWEMPVQFVGLKQEHQAVRDKVGMFDISHMGKFVMTGAGILTALQGLVPSDLDRLTPGKAQYTVLLNAQGGIIDDIIVYNQGKNPDGQEQVTLIVNAATTDKDKQWLLAHLPTEINFQDLSREKVLIALQGPEAIAILEPLFNRDLENLPAFGHLEAELLGEKGFIARTGYTGEDGFEIMVSPETGKQLWQTFLAQGVTPCGLGARDTLRLEAAMGLYGQDMDDHTTPLEAGLGWLVHLDSKGDFIGRAVLEKQKADGVKKRLVGLAMLSKQIARHDYPILHNGQNVGIVTSGTLAPTLQKAIALGYVPMELAKVGQELEVEVRGKAYGIKVVKKPFYRSEQKPR
ncbi:MULTISPECIES: glycine cleavage system aminomethyltransferase GcvT [unclassified Synechocystis]|uniref:glycine cleavage system aminomethyltransferase GcvT n=1 Tax=unclassified Synechocystis TaxID=2640012 RepID=UPI0004040D42|nr:MULTISPECIES: glycine cleavage system aminomethyltransferase GcvT [unclassified Synechocystis]AIE74998.1 Aminomethyltransferase (glycine cleavage system T protein) [Synechocystis sp. PCC 6714]MCT0253294.1 glycine cleavage system aminomethyltransferase GcvT [Synechocystis sp. CS-94]